MALDKRGDFKIWQDEFEGLCDVIAIEVERQPRTLQQSPSGAAEIIRALNCFQFVTQPVYDLLIWVLTLVSVVVAICEREVRATSCPSATFGATAKELIDARWMHKQLVHRELNLMHNPHDMHIHTILNVASVADEIRSLEERSEDCRVCLWYKATEALSTCSKFPIEMDAYLENCMSNN